jgi:glycosyltransferase involved in cell wall biosynthesis
VIASLSLSELEPRTRRAGDAYATKIMEVELCQPLPAVRFDTKYQRLSVLARLHSEPIGNCTVDLEFRELSPEHFGEILWHELGDVIAERFAAAGLPAPHALSGAGLDVDPDSWPFLQDRSRVLEAAPFISVVICTYNRPDRLQACLRHLRRQQYPAFEVIVVDNCPKTDAVREHVAGLSDPRYHYVVEPRIGLSRARNRGVSVAAGDVVAFLDDDEEPDAFWLAALGRGFARGSDVGCVTGLILPACLDTAAQVQFEELGGHSKDRGFNPAIFSRGGSQSPLYPRPQFGAGGNMAFRRDTLARIGRFDTALGAGTPALGAEDTLALTLVMLTGYKIAYEPAAFVRHHHCRDFRSLARQLRGYTVGLTAYYTALICRRPWVVIGLIRLLPDAVRAARSRAAVPSLSVVPQRAPVRNRGMLAGPAAYLRGIVRNVSSNAQQAWSSRRRPWQRRLHLGA